MAKKFKKNKVNKKQDSRVNINIKETLKQVDSETNEWWKLFYNWI